MDVNTGKAKAYRKPNNYPNYINMESSHPKNTIKALPNMIQTSKAWYCLSGDIWPDDCLVTIASSLMDNLRDTRYSGPDGAQHFMKIQI